MVNSNPGDRLHRLRHLRQALLRAADARGRARDRAARAAARRRSCSSAGRRRSSSRARSRRPACTILGTSPDAIDIAEDRRRFDEIARELGIRQPPNGTATSVDEAVAVATRGRLSRCSCGRRTCSAAARCRSCTTRRRCATTSSTAARVSRGRPVLIDRFLEDAFEVDVDAIADGTSVRDRRRHAAHRGRRHPLRRLGVRAPAVPHHAKTDLADDARAHARAREGARRRRA